MPAAADCLSACRKLEDGFAGLSENHIWRLGAVLFTDGGTGLTAVRKSSRSGYAFSGLWALPGGMVRPRDGEDTAPAAERSLADRVSKEAGLTVEAPQIDARLGPVVSHYTVDGRPCFTLIIPYTARAEAAADPGSRDHTVTEAALFSPDSIPFSAFAPANRLLVAHRFWNRLSDDERRPARPLVQAAVTDCSAWASAAGITPPPAPWDSRDRIRHWSDMSWATVS